MPIGTTAAAPALIDLIREHGMQKLLVDLSAACSAEADRLHAVGPFGRHTPTVTWRINAALLRQAADRVMPC